MVHEEMARKAAWRYLEQPDAAKTLAKYDAAIRSGFFNEIEDGYQEALGQPHFGGWSQGQVWALASLHSQVLTGGVAMARIQVLATPQPDRDRALNAAALADLPEPFTATLSQTQSGADQDGMLRWSAAATVTVKHEFTEVMQPDEVPLEVGTCTASRAYLHLLESGGVARWPYGSEWIWLFAGRPSPVEWVHAHHERMAQRLSDPS